MIINITTTNDDDDDNKGFIVLSTKYSSGLNVWRYHDCQ